MTGPYSENPKGYYGEWVKCVTRNHVGKAALGFYESPNNINSSKTNVIKHRNN